MKQRVTERQAEFCVENYTWLTWQEANADEVRSWLTHLGLAQHAYTFEAHEIDLDVRAGVGPVVGTAGESSTAAAAMSAA